MNLLKRILVLICVLSASNLYAQKFADTIIPKVSIISANIFFVTNASFDSNSDFDPKTRIGKYVIVHHNYLVYDLQFRIIMHKFKISSEIPLDVRLTFPKKQTKIFHIEDDISDFVFDDIYDYDLELHVQKGGWVIFEIGEFYYGDKNIIYDRSTLYLDDSYSKLIKNKK